MSSEGGDGKVAMAWRSSSISKRGSSKDDVADVIDFAKSSFEEFNELFIESLSLDCRSRMTGEDVKQGDVMPDHSICDSFVETGVIPVDGLVFSRIWRYIDVEIIESVS